MKSFSTSVLGFGGGKLEMRGRFIGFGNERKIHWLSWDKLTRPKSGGMGFKDLRQFNLAMLAKQGWRLTQDQESLFFSCFKARYFPRCHFLEATDSPNSFFTWKSIMQPSRYCRGGHAGE